MITFTISRDQLNALEGLSYWVADLHYMRERFGDDEPEISRARATIEKCLFPQLDRLQVPFWVQNTVICWAENWRNTKRQYLTDFLKSKNIFIG